ncbi:1-deoxy-D-xylulose-5-phosphate synthase [uncultured Muribaculum sp.]|uniref:1-deoxy-D-xylulose-5-phosphate synthase n=1 Tax=uncultured Muribaculum sp. TaxID=1918613 RepID=UPI0025DEB849|nr:1-deoxy-D-xylulose-5-phosphate synthase [uncultured Muribaculum sp.]
MEKPDTRPEEGEKYPLLKAIDSPADLRRLPQSALPAVCSEIREFLINSLSKNPGHFASSMGAVEITVALHYVFNTPYDRIVWDVGHQAYGHKLLTGRRDRFSTNRKFGGLSGFPNPDESEYDTFTAGHASNSISAALGMAVASKLRKEPRRNIVAVIGDASISGGLAFEGLNNAAITPNNLLIILNDNDMSIDRNVGALNSYLTHINTTKAYNTFRYKLYRLLRRMHLVGEQSKGFILRFNNSVKSLLGKQQNIFEGLNIRYFGPFDGHDIDRVVRVLNDIKDMDGPRILHLRTIKGKGYRPAEQDPAKWHAPGLFDAASGKRISDGGASGVAKWQDVFGETLLAMARDDRRIVGITAAMPSGTSMSIMQAAIPERVFDVGISEGHAVTFAGGLAKEGMRPFVAIYSSFTQRAYDQIIHDVAIQRLPVTLCLDRAGIVGEDGVTHHGVFDMCYLRPIPGIIISSPMDELTLRSLMLTSVKGNHGPFVIRYPRGKGNDSDWREKKPQVIPVGKGRKLRSGKYMAVLSIGPIGRWVASAAIRAEAEGISVAHYDMIFLKPIDEDILKEVAGSGSPIITVEDGMREGGLGSAVVEWMTAHGYHPEIARIGIPDCFVAHGKVPELMKLCAMDEDAILTAIREMSTGTSIQS